MRRNGPKPICLGGVRYESRAKADARRKAIFDRRWPRTTVVAGKRYEIVDDAGAKAFLDDLLALHRDSEKKRGCGVSEFLIGDSETCGSRCFHVLRTDGTKEDFSAGDCLSAKKAVTRVQQAMRNEIHDQIAEFKAKAFASGEPVRCAISGRHLTARDNNVDHYEPDFAVLVRRFARERKIDLASAEIDDGRSLGHFLRDRRLAEEWKEYHRKHARLRMTSPEANAARPKQNWD